MKSALTTNKGCLLSAVKQNRTTNRSGWYWIFEHLYVDIKYVIVYDIWVANESLIWYDLYFETKLLLNNTF